MSILLPALAVAFAATCIWLTVRIVNRRERWAKWTAVGMVVVLVGYSLSLFPIRMLEKRGILPNQDSAAGAMLWGYCAPARWLVRNGPEWIYNSLWWALGD